MLFRSTNTSGSDLQPSAPLLSFNLQTLSDSIAEGNETIGLTLKSGNATVKTPSLTTTLLDVSSALVIRLSGSASVQEGGSAAYAVNLDGVAMGAGRSISLTLDASDGTASEGSDYLELITSRLAASSGVTLSGISTAADTKAVTLTLTNSSGADLTAGAQLLSFAIPTLADFITEVPETYRMTLTSSNARVSTGVEIGRAHV